MRVITDELPGSDFSTEATVKVWVGDDRRVSTAEGNGPVNAIDKALRAALADAYPELERVHLTDFKVRILDGAGATGAVTRVLLDATDGQRDWTTIGVSPNIIEASWRALEESLVFGLLHAAPTTAGR
jgi:2-isopropylmalate synthase